MEKSDRTQNSHPAPQGKAMAGEISASDPVLHEQITNPWEICHTPLEPGAFGYRIQYLKIPGIVLYREAFDLRGHLVGISPPNTFVFSVPMKLGARSEYWRAQPKVGGMPAMLPGGMDVVVDHGQTHVVALIDLSVMRSNLPADMFTKLEHAAASHFLPATQDDVRCLGDWICALVKRAVQMPEMLHYPAVSTSLTATFLEKLASIVSPSLQQAPRPSLSSRQNGLDRALEYLRHADLATLSLPAIIKASGVSRRSLEYAFRETFGHTPLDFIKLQQMHAARRELMRASPEDTNVMKIAYRCGFNHPARFAGKYQQVFGERPYVTLKQQSRSESGRLLPLL